VPSAARIGPPSTVATSPACQRPTIWAVVDGAEYCVLPEALKRTHVPYCGTVQLPLTHWPTTQPSLQFNCDAAAAISESTTTTSINSNLLGNFLNADEHRSQLTLRWKLWSEIAFSALIVTSWTLCDLCYVTDSSLTFE
jgi:hypothetical protein